MYGDAVYWFCGCSFFCLAGCFSMIVWTHTGFECLICMRFLFLYFDALEQQQVIENSAILKIPKILPLESFRAP